jgi:hypothetical protein
MEIHQALTRSETISNILCRHEQVRVSSSSSRRRRHAATAAAHRQAGKRQAVLQLGGVALLRTVQQQQRLVWLHKEHGAVESLQAGRRC